ncbi:uncharacterized protein J4E88_008597 [Alternaria novae-zelandiae]|uniref:uncharacterized protein n=1 Tax=Alternaria novae-zelandiae TaxID=430562 RepID=UPI0020C44E3C|nr:uncharacterized protein J4E88_008597 [Alternaria novae-zelandiae]KAI4673542.1 hypothetical protein J4E88_008597 [Alternaria novae-zelandiae]
MAFSSIGISFASGSNQEPQNNNNNNNTCSVIGLPIPGKCPLKPYCSQRSANGPLSPQNVQKLRYSPRSSCRSPATQTSSSVGRCWIKSASDALRQHLVSRWWAPPEWGQSSEGNLGLTFAPDTRYRKTHLAIEYCYRTRGQFRWVFWVHALGCARFEQGYRDIADHVKIPRRQDSQVNVVKLVNDWLSDCKERWLLVLDSVEDAGPFRDNLGNDQGQPAHGPKTASRPMRMSLPYCDRGSILITTRSKNVALECVKLRDIISVGPMDEVQARALVENKLGVQERGDASVDELTAMLDYSPLAMVHSTAYISKRAPRCSVAKYIEEFKSAPKRSSPRIYEIDGHISNSWKKDSLDIQMLSSERAGTDAAVGANSNGRQVQRKRKTAIASTWQLSFEYMQSTRPSAAGLLAMMSFFDGREIPEALIRRLSKHKNAQGSQNSYGNHDFDSDKEDDVSQCGADYDAFDDDVLTLLKYNFISVRTGGTSFVMHRLVQSATRTWLDESDRVEPQRQQRISNLCAELLQGQYGNWEACQALLEHVRSVAKVDMRAPKRPPMPLLGRNSFSNADDALMADDERKVFFDARPSKEYVADLQLLKQANNFST